MRPDVKHAWIRCSLLATVSLATLAARADDLCLPLAPGVPGMYGQPPDWSAGGGTFGKKLNDPRWTGAVREDFPVFGAGMMPEVAFRGLYSGGTKIYYSLQTLVDDGVTTDNDAVYVGFASSTTSARILKVTLKTPAVLAGDLTPGNRDLATYRWNGTSWASTGLPEGWATAANAVALWVTPPGAPGANSEPGLEENTWAVHVAVDTAAGSDLGTALGGAVTKVWLQVARYHAAFPSPMLVARHKWPYASDAFDESVLTNDVTKWAALHLGTADPSCPSGIDLSYEHIGTAPDPTPTFPGDSVNWGTSAASNTFEAYPTYPGPAPSAGTIKASFRIADWGSTIGDANTSWKDIIPAPGTVNSDATGKISWPCAGSACPVLTSGTIPTGPGSVSDQCLLVQLFAGTTGGGGPPVHFIHDSVRRNLSFVHLSKFERNARISIEGLAPLTGTTDRDVYIYIKTHNMLETTTSKQPPPDLQQLMNPPRPQRGDNKEEPPVYVPPYYERLANVLPTYEVHVYHTTGRETTVGGKVIREIEPQVPFGYFALHDTTPDGWKSSIEGFGVTLESVGPNLYHVKVPNNGSVVVTTKIGTCEKYFFGLFKCCCSLAQKKEGAPAGFLGTSLLVLMIATRRRGRGLRAKAGIGEERLVGERAKERHEIGPLVG